MGEMHTQPHPRTRGSFSCVVGGLALGALFSGGFAILGDVSPEMVGFWSAVGGVMTATACLVWGERAVRILARVVHALGYLPWRH